MLGSSHSLTAPLIFREAGLLFLNSLSMPISPHVIAMFSSVSHFTLRSLNPLELIWMQNGNLASFFYM